MKHKRTTKADIYEFHNTDSNFKTYQPHKNIQIKKYAFRFWHIMMLMTMIVIFMFSSQNGTQSREVSEGTLELILLKFSGVLPEAFLRWLAIWIRKAAHYLIYLILGFNAASMMQCRQNQRSTGNLRKNAIPGWLIASAYACTDEIHQLFVPDRAGMIRDVLLDSCGAICGAVLSLCVFTLMQLATEKTKEKAGQK